MKYLAIVLCLSLLMGCNVNTKNEDVDEEPKPKIGASTDK